MNFLDAQERAERVRRRMLLLVTLAMVWVPAAGVATALWRHLNREAAPRLDLAVVWNLALEPLVISLLLFSAVLLMSVIRLQQIRSLGGAGLALEIGGREITSPTRTPQDRQLLNVVEEMGVAASMVPPRVFVLDGEEEPNALSLGQGLEDGVLMVTRGLLQTLERNELQAVVAHEIAHLRQGDAALNTWLMGVFEGLTVFSAPVRFVLGVILKHRFTETRRSWAAERQSYSVMLLLLGCVFLWLGAPVLGNMLMASVLSWVLVHVARARITRDMEYRADAVAVQLTRYPRSMATAVARLDAMLLRPEANELEGVGHMLFVRTHPNSRWGAVTASHPGCEERIRRLAPEVLNEMRQPVEPVAQDRVETEPQLPGWPTHHADASLPMLPLGIRRSLGAFDGARCAVLAVMRIELDAQAPVLSSDDPLLSFCRIAGESVHLPLFDMSLPVLRAASREQRTAVLADVDRLMHSTQAPPLVAHALRSIVRAALEDALVATQKSGVLVPRRVKEHVALVISSAARMQPASPAAQSAAFDAAVVLAPGKGPWLMGSGDPSPEQMALALRHLSAGGAEFRRKLIDAVRRAMTHDGRMTLREEIWLRAVSQALHC